MHEPKILYEDDALMVVDKPSGMPVHGGVGMKDESAPTLVDWFLKKIPNAQGVGEEAKLPDGTPIERSGVVHRLDRDTSGVIVLAKTNDAYQHLKQQFQARDVHKEYRAFVYGVIREKWGTIERPIGRSAKHFARRSAERGAKGTLRDARTDWEVIGSGVYENEHFTYVKLFPKTGRMHQIRVHLKAVDKPIVGDTLYAGKRLEQSNNLCLTRLALHAHILELLIPSGEHQRFIAPVPQEFEDAAERIAGE